MKTFKNIFKILFEPNEHVYVGDAFGVTPIPLDGIKEPKEFFCINPLSDNRSDINVSSLRNFLFEIDTAPLSDQKTLLTALQPYFASIVYSGGKSYHAIVSLEQPLLDAGTADGITRYKQTWKALAAALEAKMDYQAKFDTACQNPSRLSRMPDFVRSNGNLQSIEFAGSFLSPDGLKELIGDFKPMAHQPTYTTVGQKSCDSISVMKNFMPIELYNRLRFPQSWAASAGMYPELLKLVLWTIDSTGATKEVVVEFMQKYTFPGLLKAGYPASKLMKPIDHAFDIKRKQA